MERRGEKRGIPRARRERKRGNVNNKFDRYRSRASIAGANYTKIRIRIYTSIARVYGYETRRVRAPTSILVIFRDGSD